MKTNIIIIATFLLFNAIMLFTLLGFDIPYKTEVALIGLLINGMYIGFFLGKIMEETR